MHRRDVDEFERRAKGARSAPAAWLSKAWLAEWLKVLPQFHPAHGTTADDPSPMSEAYWHWVFYSEYLDPYHCQNKALMNRELANLINRGATIRRMEPGIIHFVVSQVSPRPAALDNSKLLCDHGQLIFDLDDPLDAEDESGIGIAKEEEWRYLQAIYGGMPEISVTKTHINEADNGQLGSISHTVSIPRVCLPCRSRRILDYSSTTFTVRVYSAGNGALSQPTPESEHAASAVESAHSGSTESSSKRRMVPLQPKADEGTRRSKRTRATKSPFKQIRILVSKWDTTMDLKLKIMQKTEIVPLYQKLLYEDVELDKNDRTIGELEIPPNAVLTLIEFDEAMDELMLDALQDDEPRYEGGFLGTGLVDHWLS
ncbi:hypothetical protein BGZ68_009156 [Mortierella alpina]|nr:hypothetical protein BGZ68_009156 [Mortierella alpina]